MSAVISVKAPGEDAANSTGGTPGTFGTETATAMSGYTIVRLGGVILPIDMRLVFPDQDATAYVFQGFFSKCSLTEAVADVIKAAVALTITGQVSGPGF